MKVSVLVKGCNPLITVIQLDVRLTFQFFGLKKNAVTGLSRNLQGNFLRANMLTGSSSKKKKTRCYNTHGQFFFGPKLSDTTAYSESHVETIKTADAFTIIIRLKYTRLLNKYVK